MQKPGVIITGASSGIGAEIARRFAREGHELLLLGRDEARLKKVQAECGGRAETFSFDLTQIEKHRVELQKKISALNPGILINNAGIFIPGTFEDSTVETWMTQFQVNLVSSVQLTQLVWPIFKNNKKGSVLNIASTLGLKPTPHTGAYSATKAAMINWSQSLAQEGGAFNIRVNCICPGIVDTPIHGFHKLPTEEKNEATGRMTQFQLLSELGQPNDVAEAAYFLASDLSRWTTGSVLSVDGGIFSK